ncbi:DnaJ subfamily B member 3 [Ananas comosus]|uniref:DnaJ subfamily B member 3 n=1 Tax=Ananas comosus TaxID=4615 RepID=A0A199VAM3_ANACO|nr:DnaJ subfamily B member 3 [Ananas comosus]
MLGTEAKKLLGFPPNSRPSSSQIKAAYRRKVLECHPDRFPAHQKSHAESRFKQISEAYSCLKDATYVRVVRTGVPTGYGRRNRALIKTPFLLLIFGTVSLGGFNAASPPFSTKRAHHFMLCRAYQRQKEAQPSYNPFLP